MKKIVVIALFFLATTSFAQGNLQFNQVISGTGVLATNGVSANQTVPTGKVWKIESINGWSSNDVGSRLGMTINTISVPVSGNVQFPVWLKAGDVLKFTLLTNPASGYATGPMNYIYSIIEFNIIP
jgi:hypothetical protein